MPRTSALRALHGIKAKRRGEAEPDRNAWLDRLTTPHSGNRGMAPPPDPMNIWGSIFVPAPGPRGRGRHFLMEKGFVRDEAAPYPRLPEAPDTVDD